MSSLVIKSKDLRVRETVKDYLNVIKSNAWQTAVFQLPIPSVYAAGDVIHLNNNGINSTLPANPFVVKDVTFLAIKGPGLGLDALQLFIADSETLDGATSNIGTAKTGTEINNGKVFNEDTSLIAFGGELSSVWPGAQITGSAQNLAGKEFTVIITYLSTGSPLLNE